jgi:hypothetical protein
LHEPVRQAQEAGMTESHVPKAVKRSLRKQMLENRPVGHTADGTYVLPLRPVVEAVKRACGLPVAYLFYYTKQVR